MCMVMRKIVSVLVASGAGGLLLYMASCSAEPVVQYGNPGNLKKELLPGEGGVEPLSCADAGPVSPDACPVSWKTDIYARMIGNAGWQCAVSGCHSGPGASKPDIDPANPATAYDQLRKYQFSKRSYVDTSGDPSKSSLECNLSQLCAPAMPLAPGKLPSNDERCKVNTWLRCGAPNN